MRRDLIFSTDLYLFSYVPSDAKRYDLIRRLRMARMAFFLFTFWDILLLFVCSFLRDRLQNVHITAGNLGRKAGTISPKVESGGLVEPALCVRCKRAFLLLFCIRDSRFVRFSRFPRSGRNGDGLVGVMFSADMGDSPTFLLLPSSTRTPQCDLFFVCDFFFPPPSEVEWLSGDDLLRCLLLRC